MQIILLSLLFMFPATVFAQKIPIEMSHGNQDHVGQLIVQELENRLARSNDCELSTTIFPRLKLYIVTMAYNSKYPDSLSFYSVSWCVYEDASLKPIYLTTTIGYWGSWKYKEGAQDIYNYFRDKIKPDFTHFIEPGRELKR